MPRELSGVFVLHDYARSQYAAGLFLSCSANEVLPRGRVSNTVQRTFDKEIEFFLGVRGRTICGLVGNPRRQIPIVEFERFWLGLIAHES